MRSARNRFLLLVGVCVSTLALGVSAATTYTCVPGYFPSHLENQVIGPMHGGAAVDRAGNVYASTDTPRGILVFGPDGKFLRNFGPSTIHGLHLQREADGEYLYCARPSFHEVQKIKTDGTVVWTMGYPAEAKNGDTPIYSKPEEFNPTNIVALRDGTLFVADGYGKKWIHKYDKDRKYLMSFGGPGSTTPAEEGKFNTCHGLATDYRSGQPQLIVCNRESGRVEQWSTDGKLIKVLQRGLRMPAAAQVRGEYCAVAELQGRVTVLDKNGDIVAQVGDNPEATYRANYGLDPGMWKDGICNSPHGITFDRAGNLVVAEWSKFGRVQKFNLTR